jgi:hypothetical protein
MGRQEEAQAQRLLQELGVETAEDNRPYTEIATALGILATSNEQET